MKVEALGKRLIPLLAGGLSTAFYVAAFPSVNAAESAYVFLIPFILWSYARPAWRIYGITAFLSQWVAWAVLLIWLRNVPEAAGMSLPLVVGMCLVLVVSLLVSGFGTLWLLALRWLLPRLMAHPFYDRLLGYLGLCGLWVFFEWMRTWFIFGFPWLPLAASQWERPVILQLSAWTGAYGVSFLLVLMNLGVGAYLWKIITMKRGTKWMDRLCPEFYTALICLFLAMVLFFKAVPQGGQFIPMFDAGVVQPNIPQRYKWDAGEAADNLGTLERQSFLVNALEPDVLLWPESATPLAAIGKNNLGRWIEERAAEWGTPILMGNLAEEDPEADLWYNGIFAVSPDTGIIPTYYQKRKLVPFGEYVPLRRVFPFIGKFVPLDGDFTPGDEALTIPLKIRQKTWAVGGLVCYEDIFPGLARSQVQAGAEFLFVATNNGWYGPEAAAYQQAAHSVLRAVENRRPVLRCGNDGWSGYIDERGQIRHVLTDVDGDIYFQGGAVLQVFRDRRYAGTLSFYNRHGDWFVGVSALLAGIGWFLFRRRPEYEGEAQDPNVLPQVGQTVRRIRREEGEEAEGLGRFKRFQPKNRRRR
jgi:apolipoprotein N-acyltransferase